MTLGLIHGTQPDALVLCHDLSRTEKEYMPGYPIPPLEVRYEDPESVARALVDVGGAERVTITESRRIPIYETLNIAELARAAGISPVEMFIRIIREGEAAGEDAIVIGQSMLESDVEAFVRRPWVMMASDGGIDGRHPRGGGHLSAGPRHVRA